MSNVISIYSRKRLSPCCQADSRAILLKSGEHYFRCELCDKVWVRKFQEGEKKAGG